MLMAVSPVRLGMREGLGAVGGTILPRAARSADRRDLQTRPRRVWKRIHDGFQFATLAPELETTHCDGNGRGNCDADDYSEVNSKSIPIVTDTEI